MTHMVMMEPQVMKLQMLAKVMTKVIILTVYQEVTFYTQFSRFLIKDDVKTRATATPQTKSKSF